MEKEDHFEEWSDEAISLVLYVRGRAYARKIAVHEETNFALVALLGAKCSSLLPKNLNLVAG